MSWLYSRTQGHSLSLSTTSATDFSFRPINASLNLMGSVVTPARANCVSNFRSLGFGFHRQNGGALTETAVMVTEGFARTTCRRAERRPERNLHAGFALLLCHFTSKNLDIWVNIVEMKLTGHLFSCSFSFLTDDEVNVNGGLHLVFYQQILGYFQQIILISFTSRTKIIVPDAG